MTHGVVVRERVPAWSASTFQRMAKKNYAWWFLNAADRTALLRFAVEADDRGVVRVATRHTADPGCLMCAAARLRDAGFLRTLPRGGIERQLVLPAHPGFLVVLDARREAFSVRTPSGRRFYELLGYGPEWAAGRRKVRAAIARIRGVDPKRPFAEPRERLEE